MQQVNFKHCWIDSASARYEQEYMISFIISQKSVMPDRILRRYLLSSTSPAAASVRLLISTAPLSTLFYSLHSFATYVNPFMRILNFYTFQSAAAPVSAVRARWRTPVSDPVFM